MKRIKTFAQLFESGELRPDIRNIVDDLNEVAHKIGFDFEGITWTTLKGRDTPLTGFSLNTDTETHKEMEKINPRLKSLILSIFFDITDEREQDKCGIQIEPKLLRNSVHDFFVVYNIPGEADKVDPAKAFFLSPSGSKPSSIEAIISHIRKEMTTNISRLIAVFPERTFEHFYFPPHEEPQFGDLIYEFMDGLISESLGEPDSGRILAEVIRKNGTQNIKVIKRLKDNEPELWGRIKPFIGIGKEETEDLADLGF